MFLTCADLDDAGCDRLPSLPPYPPLSILPSSLDMAWSCATILADIDLWKKQHFHIFLCHKISTLFIIK